MKVEGDPEVKVMNGKPGHALTLPSSGRELWRVRHRHLDIHEEDNIDDPECPYFFLVDDDDGHMVLINKEEIDSFTMAFMGALEQAS